MHWCLKEDRGINWVRDIKGKRPKNYKVRCPKCGKRLQVRVIEPMWGDDWHILLPKHKVPKAKRKRKKYQKIWSNDEK